MERHGVAVLVNRALNRGGAADMPKPARYWLKVWGDLDHRPDNTADRGANVLHLRPTTPHSHTDLLTAGLVLLAEQEGIAQ
ncbi:hypothetical protein ADK54_14040 [Streptomyces sp. WM6378]|nr:hypothetical protein ADK54_14040 [Streptomyces sp. WM6378]